MLTRLIVRRFKGLEEIDIGLGNPVVFVGPNDSGKTSALQALTLWDLGLRRWTEKRGGRPPAKQPGVVVSRRDLVGVPALPARQLWRDLRVRETFHDDDGRRTENVRIDVIVEGVTGTEAWSCGLEFDYANEESFYCRPLRTDSGGARRMPVVAEALRPRVALLGPMSGLASNEVRLDPGAIDVRLGEGRTAEVLRNLCLRVVELPDGEERWERLADRLAGLFGVRLDRPRLISERGEVGLDYVNQAGSRLDLTAAGRGMQQTLLLLAFIGLHPGSVVLLDEPDAHLEILRQRQTYDLLSRAAAEDGTQVICASHSEVMLEEAAQRGTVVAFVGSPHRIDRRSGVLKALRDIRFEDYYQAELTGFVLYLGGAAGLALLRAFAELLEHEAAGVLERPFVHYAGGQPQKARSHFHGLREAKPDLVGFALFDHLDAGLGEKEGYDALAEYMWPRRELENYLLPAKTLRRYARREGSRAVGGPLFEEAEAVRWQEAMDRAVEEHAPPIALRDPDDPFWVDTKVGDHLIPRVLESFFDEVQAPGRLRKADYYRLVEYLDSSDVHRDVVFALDSILDQARRARPHR